MNFIVIGEMIDKLDIEFKKKQNTNIDWKKAKGFRNIIAHDYIGIDAEEVFEIIKHHLPSFLKSVRKIIDNNINKTEI